MEITHHFKGQFITPPEAIKEKFTQIKAFIFDWDGVFNDGFKDADGNSHFSEVDSMGTNLLRLNYYMRHHALPPVAVISGERNKAALNFAQREHIDAIYCGIKYKAEALEHLQHRWGILPHEVAFFFDDVLDFSIAQVCGLRFMIGRSANPLLIDFAIRKDLVDYVTANDGGHGAVREVSEMLLQMSGLHDETLTHRMMFTTLYQEYFGKRNSGDTTLFLSRDGQFYPTKEL